MANRLEVAAVNAIYKLLEHGWSQRRIARELGIDRETVARYQREAAAAAPPGPKPAEAPPGSSGPVAAACEGDSNPAGAPLGSTDSFARPQEENSQEQKKVDSPSRCEPFREVIGAKLEEGLSAQRIYQDLVCEHGFVAKYHSVRRYVRRLQQVRPLPFRRMECAPGEEAQIDFGTGAPVVAPDGKRRRTHVFRIVLSHSRKAYSEVVYRQTTEEFIRCLENAFHHFGGVPKTLVPDNLKAAVIQADWFDPDLNPKIQAFCAHYGTVLLPTQPNTPRHKGKIERGIGYVKGNALKGRTFAGLEEQNGHLREWEQSVADTRIHGTTRKQVHKVFEEVERPALLPLPVERFPFFHEGRRVVNRDAHVEVERAYYSVPPQYLQRTVWVRWDARLVRIFDPQFQPIVVHSRAEPGRFRTQPEHIAPEKISGVERGATWLLQKAGGIGLHAQRWAESMLQQRGIQGVRVLQGLVSLGGRHPTLVVNQACEIAQTHGAYRLRVIRELIKRKAPPQEQFEFIDRHPIIRNLTEYGEIVRASLLQQPWTGDLVLEESIL